ncbi:protoporphyrinogen oxidase [Candidatus Binatia bacterium]|nr:protoporphyrinogen oxidase [Candidatus Binatia bacterium]
MVGGGITGLAAANRAVERGGDGVEVVLLESNARLGGVISTERRGDFLLEGGPDSFISEKPEAIALCRRIGLEDQLLPTNDANRRTLIVSDGKLIPLPDGFQLLGPTRILPFLLSPVLSWRGKLAAAKDLLLPRGGPPPGGDESLASFVRRRLGNEVLERLAQPLVGGIYTADAETLSLASTMPRFLELERSHRSVILGLRAQARRSGAAAAAGTSGARFGLFVTLRDGMATLVDALAARLPAGTIRMETPVRSIVRRDTGGDAASWELRLANDERIAADAIVVATPAPVAGRLLHEAEPALGEILSSVRCASSAVVTLAFRRDQVPDPPRAFGFVVPGPENRRVIAGSFTDVKYASRAPADTVLLRLFAGGALKPEQFALDDAALVRSARDELAELLGIVAEPLLSWVQRWPESMPQYQVGHAARIADAERRAADLPGLALAGNAYHGVGLADCVRSGEAAADAMTGFLVERSPADA